MKKTFLFGTLVCAFGLMVSCTPETIEPSPSPQQIWPKPMNRTGYVVEKITWYESETNHNEATYEYDENDRLILRTDHYTIIEAGLLKKSMRIDSLEYEDRLVRIKTTVIPDDGFWHPDKLYYYDDQGRMIRYEYADDTICFAYRNGLMDSIYYVNIPERYTTFEYDLAGNIVKEHTNNPEFDMWGYPTGNWYISTSEYEYDDSPRPNFNTDNIFMYYPVFGHGETFFPVYVGMLSQNNMTRCSEGPATWEYEYNENGLPQSVYYQFADVVPTYHTTYQFTYRPVE